MEPGERKLLQERMAELADGNRNAFDDVYALVWPLVRGFVGRHLRPAEAEDAAQEALIRVFARASLRLISGTTASPPMSWGRLKTVYR